MRMSKILAMILAFVMICACFAGCTPSGGNQGGNQGGNGSDNPLAGTYDIKVWVSEIDGVADLFRSQIAAFEAANPGIKINANVSGVTEAETASQVLLDVKSAPDIYCFAQDQLARLVQAGALAGPGGDIAANIIANNDPDAIAAASVAGKLYAYPLSSDNGFYMYYDTSLITPEDAESLEKLVEICEREDKYFRFALGNGWYNASFFFATGCESSWTMNTDGEFNGVWDTYNSDAGIVAMKGMNKLVTSPIYNADQENYDNAAVWVTGVWDASNAEEHFGDNLGVTDLPSFTVDGKSYHLSSFYGCKLLGVKPQSDSKRGAVLALLADFLTNEQSQMDRFNELQWGPSNLKAQQNQAVQENVHLAAYRLQKANGKAVMQGQVHENWWNTAALLGEDAKGILNEGETLDEALKRALVTYEETINGFFTLTEEEKRAWTVIGTFENTNWDTDFLMEEGPDGTWTSVAINFEEGDYFKVRQGRSWKEDYGADGLINNQAEAKYKGSDILVEVTGKYKVVIKFGETVTISLIPA